MNDPRDKLTSLDDEEFEDDDEFWEEEEEEDWDYDESDDN